MGRREPNDVFRSKKDVALSSAIAAGVPLVLAMMTGQFDTLAVAKDTIGRRASVNHSSPTSIAAGERSPVRLAQWFNWNNACLNGQWRNC